MDTTQNLMMSRSTADVVYERLYDQITSLELLPGSKISEADVARKLGVSRQPVRDAFKRLENIDLLEIRPQRATVVRRFSLPEIENARFVRRAVELEVVTDACEIWTKDCAAKLAANLSEQSQAINTGDSDRFHALDYKFHQIICDLSNHHMAFATISLCKQQVERLCLLSLTHDDAIPLVLEDHQAIAQALAQRDVKEVRALTRCHLDRLDATIAAIYETHSSYFQ